MPMPEPMMDEGHDAFMERCMSDDMMVSDYSDDKQRLTVCQSQWDDMMTEEDSRQSIGSGRAQMPFDFDTLEVRAVEGTGQKMIRGHGAVYNKLSVDLGGFRELFLPGAFTDSIKSDDIVSLRDHIPSYILARNRAGTLTLSEDDKGVFYEVSPPDTTYARDLMVSIERRDVTGGSIIFRTDGKKSERWLVDGKEADALSAFMAMWDGAKHKIERHIAKAKLYDIGPVTFPAYPQTDVKVRAMLAVAQTSPEMAARMLASDTLSDDERRLIAKITTKTKPDGRGAHDDGRAVGLEKLRFNLK